MKMNKSLPFVLLLLLALASLALRNCNGKPFNPNRPKEKHRSTNYSQSNVNQKGLNRNPVHIQYSKHARCRMSCRDITESEIVAILKTGKINYKKSELEQGECGKKYAVEGYSKDNQHLRVVFAPCNNEVTVVTCIDLGKEWQCDCK
jgi:hypothetical protein